MGGYIPKAELVFELQFTCGPPESNRRMQGPNVLMIPIPGDSLAVVDARCAIKTSDRTRYSTMGRTALTAVTPTHC